MGKRQEENPLERLRRRWEDNYKLYLKNLLGGCRLNSSCLGKGKVKCFNDMGKSLLFLKWGKFLFFLDLLGTAVAHWLRCCATNLKVAGSIPAGVNGIFH